MPLPSRLQVLMHKLTQVFWVCLGLGLGVFLVLKLHDVDALWRVFVWAVIIVLVIAAAGAILILSALLFGENVKSPETDCRSIELMNSNTGEERIYTHGTNDGLGFSDILPERLPLFYRVMLDESLETVLRDQIHGVAALAQPLVSSEPATIGSHRVTFQGSVEF